MDDLTNDAQRELHEQELRGRKEQAHGAFDELKGKAKKAIGDAIGNEQMEAEGAAEELGGKARKHAGDAYADAADKAEDAIDRLT